MRTRINPQQVLDFEFSTLSVTNEFYAKYAAMCEILDENVAIVDAVHKDLERALESAATEDRSGNRFEYTSDTVLRIILCQTIEGLSLRRIVIRIDDSLFLRRFVRIYDGPMMDYTTLCKLKNCISEKTWRKVNKILAHYAVDEELIEAYRGTESLPFEPGEHRRVAVKIVPPRGKIRSLRSHRGSFDDLFERKTPPRTMVRIPTRLSGEGVSLSQRMATKVAISGAVAWAANRPR